MASAFWNFVKYFNPAGLLFAANDVSKNKVVKDVVKHGLRSSYLDDVKHYGNAYLGGELTGADREANAFSAEQAQINRDWEERMSNTAMQRAVADYKAAGINPFMAAGNPASSPSASGVTSVSPSPAPFAALLSKIPELILDSQQLSIQKMLGLKKLNQERELGERELDIMQQNADTNVRNANTNESDVNRRIKETDEKIKLLIEQTASEKLRQGLIEVQTRLNTADAQTKEAFAKYADDFYKAQSEKEAAEAGLAALELGFKNKLYTKDYIDALISRTITEGKLLKVRLNDAQYNAYVDYLRSMLVSGHLPKDWYFEDADGKKYVIQAPSEQLCINMMRGIGMFGPTQTSEGLNLFGFGFNDSNRYDSPF